MLLPATHFHFFTFPSSSSSSSSSLHLFPVQYPKPKTKFLVRCSAPNSRTRTNSAVQEIADKLRSLGITEPAPTPPADEISVPFPHQLPKRRVGHTFEPSWTTPLNPVPLPGSGIAVLSQNEVAKQKKMREEELKRRKEIVPTLAELSLPDSEIRRLTTLGFQKKLKVRVAKAGITQRIVDAIHERWKHSEVVIIVCEDLCRFDLRRTHDLLERKTGGLVVWRSGRTIILYRGTDYRYPYFLSDKVLRQDNTDDALQHMDVDGKNCDKRESQSSETNLAKCAVHSSNVEISKPAFILGVGTPNKIRFQLPGEAELAEDADCLLTGLGPRFTDWWGYDPLPVDADLLPPVIHGYRKPFRLLPYGVKSKLTNDEMTTLKRLGRPLPCHFALGRNRKLQGLAAAIIKLWERCEIVKIAVKRGVQNTSSKIMAKELKAMPVLSCAICCAQMTFPAVNCYYSSILSLSTGFVAVVNRSHEFDVNHLTGGILLSRDREFIVFYRGKDFLPAVVSSAIKQQRNIGIYKLKAAVSSEIKQRRNIGMYELKAGNSSSVTDTPDQKDGTIECNSEGNGMTVQKDTKQGMLTKAKEATKQGMLTKAEAAIKRISIKLSMALEKKEKAEKHLAELVDSESRRKQEIDKEGITKEEKSMLRRIGLNMKPFLLLGRRGLFDGTVENMHLHWKYRELVKIMCKGSQEDVHHIAQALEAESGGILVTAERVKKVFAIIVYRGKNYSRPACLRPQTLLNKNQALKRSREAQRRESLKLRVLKLDEKINELKHQMVKDKEANSEQIAEALRFDLATDKHGTCSNSTNWNSPRETSVDNQQAIQEQPVEPIDGGGARGEAENCISWNSPKEASVDNQQQIHQQPIELIDGGGAHQSEPEDSLNWNSPKESSVDNQQAIHEQPVELIDGGGAYQGEPENSINWNSPKETSVDNQQPMLQQQPDKLVDSGEAHLGKLENSINWNSPKEASVSNQQAIQELPVELSDCGGAHQDKLDSWPGLILKETKLDGVGDSGVDIEHCISNSKAMESSISSSEIDTKPSGPMTSISSNELSSRSMHLSSRERLLLRKQALMMIKQPLLAIGKSNIVSGVVKTIKAHFQKCPFAIVDIKGRAKGTSVQELVFKLEQETGAVLVSREPSKVILYRGWWAAEKPTIAINVNEVSNEEETMPSISYRVRNRKRRICRIGKRRISRTGSRSSHSSRRNSTPFFSVCS
ncbi:hypothetical protein VNO77_35408 [Canavalia gladiata]|uniref:CRM domain-containing protein n=1 Tax=Canavalia gladiata TaxID=3824 RepID=A0AAN9KF45_CANGL